MEVFISIGKSLVLGALTLTLMGSFLTAFLPVAYDSATSLSITLTQYNGGSTGDFLAVRLLDIPKFDC